jgi:subtilase family serine protease
MVGAAMLGLLAIPVASASGTPAAHTSTTAVKAKSDVGYAKVKRACTTTPARNHSTCFALELVRVAKGTPGATRFVDKIPAGTQGPEGGMTPSDFATAYGYNSKASVKQTVAIVDAYDDPNIAKDLASFDSHYGLAACTVANGCFKKVNQAGGSTPPAKDTTGWSVEETLDVETVHAVCQKCKIILVEANSSSNSDLATAANEAAKLKANEISNSYGGAESGGTLSAAELADYNHKGTVITASSGDDGYYDFDFLGGDGDVNSPNTPASLPTVVAVGGTSLYLGQTAKRQNETVWNDNGPKDIYEHLLEESLGAGGGGCSTRYAAPSWQLKVAGWKSTDCGKKRLVSDISAVADPITGLDIYDTYTCNQCVTPGWTTIGGTSLASPLIAAMWGLAGGSHGVAYPASTLYTHIGSSELYDVTSGGNGYCDDIGASQCGNPNKLGEGILDCDYGSGSKASSGLNACDATKGYDGASGVGTPKGLKAFQPK